MQTRLLPRLRFLICRSAGLVIWAVLVLPGETRGEWVSHRPGFQPSFLAYGEGTFVAVATMGSAEQSRLALSTDLESWEILPLGRTAYPSNLQYLEGEFFFLSHFGGNGYLSRSADGRTWTEVTLPFGCLGTSIARIDGRWVIGCENNLPYSILTSEDGVAWTDHLVEEVDLSVYRLAVGDGPVVAIGGGPNGFRHAVSADGVNWKGGTMAGQYNLGGLAYSEGKWVGWLGEYFNQFGINPKAFAAVSANGSGWAIHEVPGFDQVGGVTSTPAGFAAIGVKTSTETNSYLLTSMDGQTWSEAWVAEDSIRGILAVGDSLFLSSYDTIYRLGPLPGSGGGAIRLPWTGSDPVGEDTYLSPWFGRFVLFPSDFIYHLEHGWLYTPSTDPGSIWLWQDSTGWIWTGPAVYPFLYRESHSAWLFYLVGGEPGTRFFFDFSPATRDWILLP